MRSASDVLRLFVLPDFGDREVESLTPQDIREWQERIIAKGFGYKYKAKIYCGFTAMLNYGIKFHDLRENVVSRVEDLILLSKRLGHRDVKETLNTYSHLFPNAQRKILESIDEGAEM